MALFQLTEKMMALEAVYDANFDPESGEVLDAGLDTACQRYSEALLADEASELDACVNIIKQAEMEESKCREQVKYWQEKARVRAGKQDWMKGVLKAHLEKTKKKFAVSKLGYKIALQLNSTSRIEWNEVDLSQLDERFITRPPVPAPVVNTVAVAQALASGESLSWARLLPRDSHIRIR